MARQQGVASEKSRSNIRRRKIPGTTIPRSSRWQQRITGPLGLYAWVRSCQLRRKAKPESSSQRAAGFSIFCVRREGLARCNGETKERSGASRRDLPHPSCLRFLGEHTLPTPPQIYPRLMSSADPPRGGHQSSLQRRALEGPRPSTRPRTHHPHPRPRKRRRYSSHSVAAREWEHRPAPGRRRCALRPRAPPSSVALTSTAFPKGPASAANDGLRPLLHQLFFYSPSLGEGRCRIYSAGKQFRSSAHGVPASRTGHFPQQPRLLPVSPRPPQAPRASRESGAGLLGEAAPPPGRGHGAESRCGDPGCSHQWGFQSS